MLPASILLPVTSLPPAATVISRSSTRIPDKYTVIENVPTKKSARTMGLDLKTHNIFFPLPISMRLPPASAAAK